MPVSKRKQIQFSHILVGNIRFLLKSDIRKLAVLFPFFRSDGFVNAAKSANATIEPHAPA